MKTKLIILFFTFLLFNCDCLRIYSSFWEPLFNPKILNYKVDAIFEPNAGKMAREDYQRKYGYRGESLIAGLGNGVKPSGNDLGGNYGDVKFYYTYKRLEEDYK